MNHDDTTDLRHRLGQRRSRHLSAMQLEARRLTEAAAKLGATRVILFGSMANGTAGLCSDLDLLIELDSKLDFLSRTADIYSRLKPRVGTDLLVYTPLELERMKSNPLIKRALKEGQVLYEA